MILHNETLYQKSDDGVPILEMVKALGIVPGVTLDKGWVEMPGTSGKEVYTQGMDDLDERCAKLSIFHDNHAHFQM